MLGLQLMSCRPEVSNSLQMLIDLLPPPEQQLHHTIGHLDGGNNTSSAQAVSVALSMIFQGLHSMHPDHPIVQHALNILLRALNVTKDVWTADQVALALAAIQVRVLICCVQYFREYLNDNHVSVGCRIWMSTTTLCGILSLRFLQSCFSA